MPCCHRFQYEKSAAFICSLLDPLVEAYKQAAHLGTNGTASTAQAMQQLAVLEGQLAWMVYIVGSVIKGRLTSSSAESQVGCM